MSRVNPRSYHICDWCKKELNRTRNNSKLNIELNRKEYHPEKLPDSQLKQVNAPEHFCSWFCLELHIAEEARLNQDD